jgi:hypothetical protein
MKPRNLFLSGIGLCILTIVFSGVRYPDFGRAMLDDPGILAILSAIIAWYVYTALLRVTPGHFPIRQSGMKWGVAISGVFVLAALAQLAIPREEPGPPLTAVAILLPFIAGAVSAVSAGRIRAGLEAGFWAGIYSGVMTFLAFAAIGLGRSWISGASVGFALEMAGVALFLFGPVFCPLAGAIGGLIGILLERTGRPSAVLRDARE